MVEDREGGLRRWSRLKRRAATAQPDEAVAPVEAPLPVTPGEDGVPTGDDEAVPLPAIDSLDKDSDFTPFLADGVPEDIARAALRKMWLSDPIFAFRDGLDDYDEDFTIIEKIAKALTGDGKEGRDSDATEEEADAKTETETETDAVADSDQIADGEEVSDPSEDDAAETEAAEAAADDDDENSGTPPNVSS